MVCLVHAEKTSKDNHDEASDDAPTCLSASSSEHSQANQRERGGEIEMGGQGGQQERGVGGEKDRERERKKERNERQREGERGSKDETERERGESGEKWGKVGERGGENIPPSDLPIFLPSDVVMRGAVMAKTWAWSARRQSSTPFTMLPAK